MIKKTLSTLILIGIAVATVGEDANIVREPTLLISNTNGNYYLSTNVMFAIDVQSTVALCYPELVTNWHTVTTEGTNDWQAGVIESNYVAEIIFNGQTNLVTLLKTNLPSATLPMRIVPTVTQSIYWIANPYRVQPLTNQIGSPN